MRSSSVRLSDRDRTAGLRCGLLSDPGVNVVVDQRLLQPAEIADAGAAAKDQESEDGKRRGRAKRTELAATSQQQLSAAPHAAAAAIGGGGGICGSAFSAAASA